jgi:hypothetical protein
MVDASTEMVLKNGTTVAMAFPSRSLCLVYIMEGMKTYERPKLE